MKPMNNFLHLIDVKLSIIGACFIAINLTSTDVFLKIIGSLLFIGYTAHRWYLMIKENKKE